MSAKIIPHIIDFIKQYMRNDFVVDVCIEMVLAKISDSWVVEARYRETV